MFFVQLLYTFSLFNEVREKPYATSSYEWLFVIVVTSIDGEICALPL